MMAASDASGSTRISGTRPQVLLLSFMPIDGDPRVMKQVTRLIRDYDLTTCSPGGSPHPDVAHVELRTDFVAPRSLPSRAIDVLARATERFSRGYFHTPGVIQTAHLLQGRSFDAVIANDAETVGIASRLFGADRVHADLHEFFPDMGFDGSRLGRRQQRYWTWMTRKLVSKASSSSTVGREIAQLYREHGVEPSVVTNSTHLRDLHSTPTGQTIRLVYSGNAFRDWGLGEIMHAVSDSSADLTLDLYLTHNAAEDRQYHVELAQHLGDRIEVREPVPQSRLIETLNNYDVGIFVLPPLSPNSALALPNKFFDYVQARLGIVVGPSVEMARIVREHGLGLVTESFDAPSIKATLDALTPQCVDAFKNAAVQAADELSSEKQVEVWAAAVAAIVARGQNAR